MENNSEKICPKCQTANPIAANFCRHCRHEFSEASKKGLSLSPEIQLFKIKESTYTIGSAIHVEWKTSNVTKITLNDTEVPACSESEIVVEQVASLILTAENDYGSVSKKLTIAPSPLPSVIYFRASAGYILIGNVVNLEWKVNNASKIEISSSAGMSFPQSNSVGAIRVKPTKTTVYCIRCYANGDQSIYVEQEVEVRVLEPVKIVHFKASNDVIVESKKTSLHWDVKNATSIKLLPLHTDVTNIKKIDISPSHTTEYRLVATNELSQDEATVTIVVQQLPKIHLDGTSRLAGIQLPSFASELPYYQPERKSALPIVSKLDVIRIIKKTTFSNWRKKWDTCYRKVRKILNRKIV